MSLLLPKHKEFQKPLPLLVWCCGGAFMVMDKDIWIPELVPFAKAGFVVASVEYRTSNDIGFPAALQDVKAAIRYLRAHAGDYCIDPDHIFAAGESAGGNLACMLGVTGTTTEFDTGDYLEYSSAVQGVIDLYGAVDMNHRTAITPELTEMGNGIDPLQLYLGGAVQDPSLVQKADTLAYVTKQTPPFLILHGTHDVLVDQAQSDALYDTLRRLDVPCDYYIFEGTGHGADEFYQPSIIKIMIEFLERQVNPSSSNSSLNH